MPVETNVTAPIEEVWRAYTTPEDIKLECALDGGQFQAAFLTGCWACRSSYCAGLR
jgi:hypothetical protein